VEVLEMPIYEYRCHKCGQTIEIMQKFSDAPMSRCPQCNGKISKIISNCSFHLKGSGWYVTDYKKNDSTWKDKPAEEKKTETPKTEAPVKADAKKD
jgi:putative FmdB family regulatory protein